MVEIVYRHRKLKDILDDLEERGCKCDIMCGDTCEVHVLIVELKNKCQEQIDDEDISRSI